MFNRSLFSSATGDWSTPQEVYDWLDAEYGPFTLDPCASSTNAKCPTFFTVVEDGLAQKWEGRVFVNPPYGRGIGEWIAKCYQSAQEGALVVALLPSRTDTAWWHDYVMKADQIRFLRGRLKFGGSSNSAPFPSVVVVWGSA